MRFIRLIPLLVFLSFAAYGQTITISGKVTTSVSQSGVGHVSVFLSNSSYGTETAEDGTFQLYGVKPGQYDLVASSVGYQDFSKTILVGNAPIKMDIQLQSKVTELRGVVITTNADWKKNYEEFRKAFIGTSENAKNCVVVNPHEVNMVNHARQHTLEAWSNDFVVVENRSLGYRVKFLIDSFSINGLTGIISREGKAVFQELPGSTEQKRLWKERRKETYYGSSRHFLHALYTSTVSQDGFIMYRFSRTLNPERPQEDIILQKIKKFREVGRRDSFNYWVGKDNLSRYANENLVKTPLQPYQVCTQAGQKGLFVLKFPDHLYVIYTRKHEETDFKDVYRPLDMENYETSILSLLSPDIIFDMNGVVVGGSTLDEGTWSKARLAEMLPYDYSPDEDK